ncbi:MAG TPA: long-chain fatty acid--CoA ligase, partial [Alphaproteobacteria bacterium]|nr:long-chain fatty acid--CoA ligase [Alphaproteobacteria bacterium]
MTHLISGARRLALTDMVARAQQAATGFERLGISAGDRVILYLRNDFAFFDASRALGALGAYPVPLNWHASLDEAQYIFQDSGAKAAVVHADFWALARQAAPSDLPMFAVETPPEIAAAYHVPPDLCGTPQGAASWDAFVADHPPRPVVAGDPPGAMIYTS